MNWIHTKFMQIDPLGTKPIFTGPANWSVPSVTDRDESVLGAPTMDVDEIAGSLEPAGVTE